jgi:hypothetical protein
LLNLGIKPEPEAQNPKNLNPNPYRPKPDTHIVSMGTENENSILVRT